jgi:hypothetical protein
VATVELAAETALLVAVVDVAVYVELDAFFNGEFPGL